MFFDTVTTFLTTCIVLAFLSVAPASPLLSSRDVVTPKIITPNADTVWTVGHVEVVTWDTSNLPQHITNPIGRVILGYEENNSLNLDLDHPLALGFNITDGTVQITVPNVTPRNDYIIVLYGDSGNTSPAFTITRIVASSSSSLSPSSSPPSTEVVPSQNPSQSYPSTLPPVSAALGAIPATSPLTQAISADDVAISSSTVSTQRSSTSTDAAATATDLPAKASHALAGKTYMTKGFITSTTCMMVTILHLF